MTLLISVLVFALQSNAEDAVSKGALPRLNETVIEADAPKRAIPSTLEFEKELKPTDRMGTADVAAELPGVQVYGNSQSTQGSFFSVRGAGSGQNQVSLNGFLLTDVSSPSSSVDLNTLGFHGLESLSILKGTDLLEYGPGNMSGLLLGKTRIPKQDLETQLALSSSSQGLNRTHLDFATQKDGYMQSLSAFRIYSTGISSADENLGNTEKDSFEQKGVITSAGFKASSKLHFEGLALYNIFNQDLDKRGGPQGDDPNFTQESHSALFGGRVRYTVFPESTWVTTQVSHQTLNRTTQNLPDQNSMDRVDESYWSQITRGKMVVKQNLHSTNQLKFGVETQQESFDTRKLKPTDFQKPASRAQRTGVFAMDSQRLGILQLDGGFRGDAQAGEPQNSGVISPALIFESIELNVRGTFQKGVKFPSLFQLYSPYGTKTLNAEQVNSLDLSIEKRFEKWGYVSGSLFGYDYTDLIDFDYIENKYANIGRAQVRGGELAAEIYPLSYVGVSSQFTRMSAQDVNSGIALLRRSSDQGRLGLKIFNKSNQLEMTSSLIGSREDIDPISFQRVTLGTTVLWGLRGSTHITKNLEFFARGDNLTDVRYQSVAGYGSPGRSVEAGISGSF